MSAPFQFPRRPSRIRILLADDSAVMRSILHMVLDPHPELEVIGAAATGEEVLAGFEHLHPDLVLLDIEMPGMNGLEALSALRRRDPRLPVIMCSTLTTRGARTTLEALARGATDYVSKPEGQKSLRDGVELLSRALVPKILALFPAAGPPVLAETPSNAPAPVRLFPRIVVMGVSTGGPAALEAMLPRIPASFPLPILIVQHMPRLFTGLLAERLNERCPLRVREAAANSAPERGVVDIARGDWHLEITQQFRLRLTQGEPENFCRPSVDVLFRTAAAACAGHVLAVVLTGMGSDGLAGCRAVRSTGGTIFAQDAATSVIWGMPGAVAHAGLADKILSLDAMADAISRCVTASQPAQAAALAV